MLFRSLIIAGTFYGYRQFLTRQLINRGVNVQLFGSSLPRWVDPIIARKFSGRYLVREEKSRVLGEALAVLNSTALSEGAGLTCRVFEAAGAGALQLVERRPIVETCFAPDHELLCYDSLDEILAHLDRARRFPHEVQQIRLAGHRRAVAQHTYRHRLDAILNTLR